MERFFEVTVRVGWVLSLLGASALGLTLLTMDLEAQAEKKAEIIRNGSMATIEYTLFDERGDIIESSKGKEPLRYTHGKGQIIEGLEKELEGMAVGEENIIRVKPEDAYGPIVPEAFKEVDQERIPADARKVGETLTARNANGETYVVRVHEIKEKTVILDFNHPLAGKTLTFEVKIVGILFPQKK
jgi:FKBP-type peptidyl-prolyl cis-trans isomerase 2